MKSSGNRRPNVRGPKHVCTSCSGFKPGISDNWYSYWPLFQFYKQHIEYFWQTWPYKRQLHNHGQRTNLYGISYSIFGIRCRPARKWFALPNKKMSFSKHRCRCFNFSLSQAQFVLSRFLHYDCGRPLSIPNVTIADTRSIKELDKVPHGKSLITLPSKWRYTVLGDLKRICLVYTDSTSLTT